MPYDPSLDNSPITRVVSTNADGSPNYSGGGGGGGTTADGAASPNASLMVGGEYNSSPPTLSNGTVNTGQLDSSGRLITNNAPLNLSDTPAISLTNTALPTPVSAGTITTPLSDKYGRLVMLPQGFRDIVGQQSTTITASTSPVTVVSAISAIKTDISSIVLVNSSAAATLATLSDGTNNYLFYVPAGDMRGASYNVPLPATTANTAWTVACGTSITSLLVTVVYVKNT